MYIEDLIILLDNLRGKPVGASGSWVQHPGVVNSLSYHCKNNIGLTYKQREMAIKILKKNQKILKNATNKDVLSILDQPEFKFHMKEIIKDKTAELKNINDCWVIEIKFPYDGSIINLIQKHRQTYLSCIGASSITFDYISKAWVMSLNEINLVFTNQLLQHGFTLSEELLSLNKKVNEILSNSKEYVPYIGYDQGYSLKNIKHSIPQLNTSSLHEALLHARKHGVFEWDDIVQENLKNDPALHLLENYFRGPAHNVFMMSDLIPFLRMCNRFLVVLPKTINIDHIIKIHEYLKECNIDSTEISTLVRKDNKKNLKFNSYIKDNKLNNRISNQTRVIIASRTNPKIFNDTTLDIILCVQEEGTYGYIYKALKNYIEQSHNFVRVNI